MVPHLQGNNHSKWSRIYRETTIINGPSTHRETTIINGPSTHRETTIVMVPHCGQYQFKPPQSWTTVWPTVDP